MRIVPLLALSLAPLAGPAAAGDLLVTSRFTDQVLRYDALTGAFRGVLAQDGGLDNPVGLSFGPGGELYVASADSHRVLRFHGRTGAFLGALGGAELVGARQLNFGPDGHLYVADGAGDRILRYDGMSGALLGVFASGGGLDGPTSFAFGPDGDLYVGSVLTDRVLRYDGATGAPRGVFASALLDGPHDVAFGPEGDLYVTNAFAHRIVRFDGADGSLRGVFVDDPALQFALGMTWTGDGRLLVCNQGANEVRAYDARTGAPLGPLVASGAGGLSGPLFAALAPEGGGARAGLVPPAQAGSAVWFSVAGAPPGATVEVWLGAGPGRTAVPGCTDQALDLAAPRRLGGAVADEGGRALLQRFLPAAFAGRPLHLQVLQPATCGRGPAVELVVP